MLAAYLGLPCSPRRRGGFTHEGSDRGDSCHIRAGMLEDGGADSPKGRSSVTQTLPLWENCSSLLRKRSPDIDPQDGNVATVVHSRAQERNKSSHVGRRVGQCPDMGDTSPQGGRGGGGVRLQPCRDGLQENIKTVRWAKLLCANERHLNKTLKTLQLKSRIK